MLSLPPFPPSCSPPGSLPARVGQVSLFSATLADLPFLRRLYRTTREDELAPTGWPEPIKAAFCDSQFDLQHLHYVHHFPQAAFATLRLRQARVGRLYVDASGASAHLIDIALLPSARGKGIGSSLLRALQTHAAAAGKPLTLQVYIHNSRARHLYKALGFVAGEMEGAHLAMRWPG